MTMAGMKTGAFSRLESTGEADESSARGGREEFGKD